MASVSAVAIAGWVSAAAGAAGAIGTAYSQKKSADFNAKKAQQEANVGVEQERLRLRRVRGAAEASAGASGLAMEGSPLDIMESNAINSEQNALMIQYGATQQKSILEAQGDNAMTTGYFKAGTTLLSSAANKYKPKKTTDPKITTYDTTPVPQSKPISGY